MVAKIYLCILTFRYTYYTLSRYRFFYLLIPLSGKSQCWRSFMSLDSSHFLGQTVGAKIRAARLAKKYTQSQLARPDFSVSYISAIERGQIQPSIRALEILAKRLEISTSDLLPSHDQVASGSSSLVISDVVLKETTRELVLLET